jgi:hypothetical protein
MKQKDVDIIYGNYAIGKKDKMKIEDSDNN